MGLENLSISEPHAAMISPLNHMKGMDHVLQELREVYMMAALKYLE